MTPRSDGPGIAVVTGASGGIGRAIADDLAAAGTRVAYVDRIAPEGLADSRDAVWVSCDVSRRDDVDAAFDRVEALWGPAHILICAAGVLRHAPVAETTDVDLDAILDVNVAGSFRCIRRALPGMRRTGRGRILLLASAAGLTGGSPGLAAYAMSKGAIITLTKAVAREVVGEGITVNAIAPGPIDTSMIGGLYSEPAPVGRLGTPSDVSRVAAMLLSEQADYITGEVIGVDGGFRLR